MGLGDHILCNAIVRREAAIHPEVLIPVYAHNLKSVEFMYRDLQNVKFHVVKTDDEARALIGNHDSLRLGFAGDGFRREIFDQSFYRQAGMEFSERWSGFKVCRDQENEVKIPFRPFWFVHDDPGRGFWMTKLTENICVWRPPPLPNIFQLLWALENAEEIHCINSSFLILADSIPTFGKKLVFHWYARKTDHPILKKDWEILE